MDQTPENSPKPLPRLSTLRTYQGDINSVVRGENISMTGIAVKERERQLKRGEETPEESRKTGLLIAISVLLVLLGTSAVSYVLFFRNTEEGTTPTLRASQSLIFANTETQIDVTGLEDSAVARQIRRALTQSRTLGTVEDLVLTTKTPGVDLENPDLITPLSTGEFFARTAPRSPSTFVRLLDSRYMYGIHGYGTNYGFLFFRTNDQENAYSELLSWEKSGMARDLLPLLREETDTTGISSPVFQDALIKNIDTRILKRDDGSIALIYAFLNPTNLVIAGSEETFGEVLRRFTTPRPVAR